MEDKNFSLLSQEEIDTLVAFLTDKHHVESAVLSQESIDKLVHLVKNYACKSAGTQGAMYNVRSASSVLLPEKNWSLEFEIRQDNGFMSVYATDGAVKEYITPRGFSCACFADDDSVWGYAVCPAQFVEIAKSYDLKFTKQVYEQVSENFAKCNFGDSKYEVNEFYMATTKDLLSCLM